MSHGANVRSSCFSFAQSRSNLTRIIATLAWAWQDVRGGSRGNRAIGVFTQQESRLDQLLGRTTNDAHVPVLRAVSLFERRTRIAGRSALGLGHRERHIA